MKRKRLLFLLLLALMAPWAANAQTSLWSEDFEGGSMPAGWTTDGPGNWSIATAVNSTHPTSAGNGTYCAQINHGTTGNATKLITPEINLSTVTSAELSFMHVQQSWAGDIDELKVYYRTSSTGTWTLIDGQDYTSAYASWTTEEGIVLPNLSSTYQIAFEYVDHYGYGLGIDYVQIVQGASCVKPNGLTAALTQGNGSIATLSWSAGATETAWVLEYGTAADFTGATSVNVSGTPSKDLTGLTPETTYYARVKASCGGGDESEWSTTCEFTPTNAYALTVNDGTTTNGYVPIYGYYVDAITNSQFIIPAEKLANMAWGTINKMTFYASNSSVSWGNAKFEVYMTETGETTLSSLADFGTMTKVKNAGSLSISGNVMEVILDAPYQYTGGNLMIGFLQTVTGSWSSCNWYGISAEGASMGGYGTSINQQNFLPKTTFDYEPGEVPACMWPTNLAVNNITPRTAELSWTSDGTAWEVEVVGEYSTTWNASAIPFTLQGLEPETEYTVRVRTVCDTEVYSDWSTPVSFTTEVACPAPTDLVISDITAYSANVAWTSDNTNIEMRYSVDVRPITTFDDSQMHNWTNIDADGDGFEWVLGSKCGGIYLAEGGSLAGTGHNSSADLVTSGSYSNFTSGALTPDNYLVSPQITLGGSISFWAQAQDASFAAEHFGVAVSTTGNTDPADFTTIAEWTFGSRSANVLRSSNAPRGGNRDQTEWVQYTVDLSAYSGQGYVAIRHFDCTDMFMLNVDDIYIEQPGFEMPWVYVTNPASPQALTNLEPETNYLVQVRANCGGEDGVSQWLEGTFTTLPSCMVPTNLVISNIDKRSADLAWTSNGDETAWQIEISDSQNPPVVTIYDVTTTSFTLPGLQPETRYSVRVRAVCDETLQSAWSSPAVFTTLVACPAPTALAISDITNVSAVATWTYDGDVEFEYAEDVWKYYDNGIASGSLGYYGTFSWAIMLTPDMLPASQPLTHVAVYENQDNTLPITVSIYSGGNDAPGTLLYTEDVTPVGNGFHEFALNEAVTFDATQNLWIVCFSEDQYPAVASTNTGTTNGGWGSIDNGTTWGNYSSSYTWMIRAAFGNNTTEWVAVNNPASPQTIAGLTPETNYMVRLRAVCGGEDGESVWVTTSFTTDIACPAPYALAATPYANSAVLSWEGISESYTVSYREPAVIGGIDEKFATSSAPTGWTMYTGLLSNVMENPSALTSATYGWTFGTGNGVFDSHARCNIYSNYQRWLVTPAIEVPAGAAFSFDMALTAYSGTLVAPATTGTDDRFVVLVSTDEKATWSILRQWDNAGSEYVYNNITCSATGEHVSFDFSAYAGQTVYIAFYGESTESNADNNLHIDNVNVTVAELVPAGEWMTVNVDEATATLTGLTPETKYEWKVQGDCGDFGMSEESAISSFTTTEDTCPTPTNLTVDAETLTFNTADLSWNGSPDVESFTVRYRVPEHAAAGSFYEPFNNSGVPAGWTRYSGLVDDVVAGTTTLSSTTSGWIFSNTNVFGQYHAKVNIYGTSGKYWLVTPEVTPTSGNLSFDLALTDYSNANPIEDPTAQADDRFVVLVYANETWTILREWNNSGSAYVYNTIATEGEAVSIDLSAYVGQTVKIAFYGESTVSGNGDNDLHIDNVLIGEMIPATDWQMVEGITDMNVTLTGLTPETLYEAQVKSDCSDPEAWSTALNFTTAPLPIQTIALAEGWNWVSFDVEITLDDLKAALIEAVPGTAITIRSKTQNYSYNPNNGRWSGRLTWDLSQMYLISVVSSCEVAVQNFPIDPAEHPANVLGNGQFTWIAFPLSESMTLTNAFAGFAVNGDIIRAKTANSQYSRGRWMGSSLTTLQPGSGYIYKSSTSAGNRTLTFPVGNRQ